MTEQDDLASRVNQAVEEKKGSTRYPLYSISKRMLRHHKGPIKIVGVNQQITDQDLGNYLDNFLALETQDMTRIYNTAQRIRKKGKRETGNFIGIMESIGIDPTSQDAVYSMAYIAMQSKDRYERNIAVKTIGAIYGLITNREVVGIAEVQKFKDRTISFLALALRDKDLDVYGEVKKVLGKFNDYRGDIGGFKDGIDSIR